jgi:hypothetical protein
MSMVIMMLIGFVFGEVICNVRSDSSRALLIHMNCPTLLLFGIDLLCQFLRQNIVVLLVADLFYGQRKLESEVLSA